MQTLMFVGSANRFLPYVKQSRGSGISVYRVDLDSGRADLLDAVADIDNPTFIDVAPDGASLAAVSENAGQIEGRLTNLAIDRQSGKLRALGSQPTGGWTPAHLSHDRSGQFAGVANYGDVAAMAPAGLSVAIFRKAADGVLGERSGGATHQGHGPDAARQDRPHAHCVRWTPDNRTVLVVDLGIDRVVSYRFDAASGAIAPSGEVALRAGSGPRHLAFHPGLPVAYVIGELTNSVATLAMTEDGLALLDDISTLPAGWRETSYAAAIKVAPNGRQLFAANRGHDSIARFDIAGDGRLSFAGTVPSGGQTPRDFAFDATGRVLAVANQASDAVNLFRYDGDSGALTPLGEPIRTGTPTGIAFDPLPI